MTPELTALLREGLERLGIRHTAEQLATLGRYVDEIERWNPRYGMVRAAGRELVVRHILDCLAALPWLRRNPHGRRMADMGSGAGLPGIPLAVFLEDCRITLVERSARRAGFLRNAAVLLGLPNVEVLQKDLREIPGLRESPELRENPKRFDVVLFRAFAPLPGRIKDLMRVTAPDGIIVAYKGREERLRREIAELDALLDARLDTSPVAPQAPGSTAPGSTADAPLARIEVVRLEVPFLVEEERHLVILHRGLGQAHDAPIGLPETP